MYVILITTCPDGANCIGRIYSSIDSVHADRYRAVDTMNILKTQLLIEPLQLCVLPDPVPARDYDSDSDSDAPVPVASTKSNKRFVTAYCDDETRIELWEIDY